MAEIVRAYHGSCGGLHGAIADAKRLITVYPGYHTLDCDMAIRRLKGEFKGK